MVECPEASLVLMVMYAVLAGTCAVLAVAGLRVGVAAWVRWGLSSAVGYVGVVALHSAFDAAQLIW